ncbi:ParB/RepB/Spo0J family partition protein [Cardinium endosymbiont of Culicoides punctatus]|uniref:ParB/RepB/Spo0J family partition protein n=1 Tax=Cardinium endosymbiont of Culicoides punctatus TaxID=2304601 RepID=UPI00105871C7|nr:ParB/RepB/Spo0J family partition protein [Cardinium endosymbiont of Culicoides punctatus]TDG94534.1 Chromosome-partitioning protein Spo0J [Cardinium endosymbiont of Culicoides punctatus]
MARKIKYREISMELENITKPTLDSSSRSSIGLDKSVGEFYFLEIDQITPFKNQARKFFDIEELSKLSDSIKEHGICQPLTVTKNSDGKYEVVSGERRLRAAKLAGLHKVPCIILKEINNANAISLIENIHRADLTPIELGIAFSNLIETSVFDNQEHLAKAISVSKSKISEYIKFSKLPESIKNKLKENDITSRKELRNITKALNKNDINEVDSIISSSNRKRKVQILQVFLLDDNINIDDNGLNNINALCKKKLKNELQKVIDRL